LRYRVRIIYEAENLFFNESPNPCLLIQKMYKRA